MVDYDNQSRLPKFRTTALWTGQFSAVKIRTVHSLACLSALFSTNKMPVSPHHWGNHECLQTKPDALQGDTTENYWSREDELGGQPVLQHKGVSQEGHSREDILKTYFVVWSTRTCVHAKSLSRVWLCDPMDYSSPGSSVQGIFPASILGQVAISTSRGFSWPRDQTHNSCIPWIARQIL